MTATTMLKIDGATVASTDLEDRGTFGPPLGQPLGGPMATAGRRLWQSADGSLRTGLWACTEGRFWTAFDDGEGEFIRIVAGRLTCAEDGGPTTRLEPGDSMLFPSGWAGEWRIEGTLRKVLAGWTGGVGGPGRGAGPGTTTPKIGAAEAAAMALEDRGAFPPERTGGKPLRRRGRTLWRSANGAIEVGVWGCDAGRFEADFRVYGELLHVVGGQVVCTPNDGGPAFTLRAGDAATFPRGWTGEWDVRAPLRKVYACWEAW